MENANLATLAKQAARQGYTLEPHGEGYSLVPRRNRQFRSGGTVPRAELGAGTLDDIAAYLARPARQRRQVETA